eukprot:CAMPEP_0185731392 /NCGR_PEP_ID=MMETSP1171-20130828/12798_1 /TAXON_ID=374046 /ORGANISM="Helicotheca tamensis, Strain CCMP826" /LENGTH=97 /DNA_ID=CAMNT_0028400651 /DNA_START=17 /DNA_END=307 /DNA_ORIENTATION=+
MATKTSEPSTPQTSSKTAILNETQNNTKSNQKEEQQKISRKDGEGDHDDCPFSPSTLPTPRIYRGTDHRINSINDDEESKFGLMPSDLVASMSSFNT